MSNLIENFLKAERAKIGGRNADVIRKMNETLDTKYQQGRVNEWSIGKKKPSPEVISYMMIRALPMILSEANISVAKSLQIIESCLLPEADES